MGKIIKSNQEMARERVYKFYLENRNRGKNFTVKHFNAENIAKSTIYDIIDRAEDEKGPKRVSGSGRVAKKMPKAKVSKLKAMFDHKDGVSQRQVARKFSISQTYVCKILKNKSEIRYRKKQIIPARSEKQKAKIKTLCGRLYRKFSQFTWVIDDESYFTLKHSTINGNDGFYTSDISQVDSTVKYVTKTKHEDKVLVWICISTKVSRRRSLVKVAWQPIKINI